MLRSTKRSNSRLPSGVLQCQSGSILSTAFFTALQFVDIVQFRYCALPWGQSLANPASITSNPSFSCSFVAMSGIKKRNTLPCVPQDKVITPFS